MNLKFTPGNDNLSKVLRDYQEEALKLVWKKDDEGVTSRDAWLYVNEALGSGNSISRASIINFLNDMVDEGVLNYNEITGKGGYRRVYRPKPDEKGFKKALAESVISSLMRDFPQETKLALKGLNI